MFDDDKSIAFSLLLGTAAATAALGAARDDRELDARGVGAKAERETVDARLIVECRQEGSEEKKRKKRASEASSVHKFFFFQLSESYGEAKELSIFFRLSFFLYTTAHS